MTSRYLGSRDPILSCRVVPCCVPCSIFPCPVLSYFRPVTTIYPVFSCPVNVLPFSAALTEIIDSTDNSIPCASTGAVVTVDFNADITDATVTSGDAVFGGSQVVFEVPDLEATPTTFSVVLTTCDSVVGGAVVASVTYADDQLNVPDRSSVEAEGVVPDCGESIEWLVVGWRESNQTQPRLNQPIPSQAKAT